MKLKLLLLLTLVLSTNLTFADESSCERRSCELQINSGRFTYIDETWLKQLSLECHTSIQISKKGHFTSKTFYVTYTGDQTSLECFYDGVQQEVSRYESRNTY